MYRKVPWGRQKDRHDCSRAPSRRWLEESLHERVDPGLKPPAFKEIEKPTFNLNLFSGLTPDGLYVTIGDTSSGIGTRLHYSGCASQSANTEKVPWLLLCMAVTSDVGRGGT